MTMPDPTFFLPKVLIYRKKPPGNSFFGVFSGSQYTQLDAGAVYSVIVTSHVNYDSALHVSTRTSGAARIASYSIPAMAENYRVREVPVPYDELRYLSVQANINDPEGGTVTVRMIPIPSSEIL